MSNDLLRLPETPSELLAWLAALDRDASNLRVQSIPKASAATLTSLAAEVPTFLERTVLREAPQEAFSQQAWLRQIDQLKQAQQVCSTLNAAEFPWASALTAHLSQALELRAPAIQALQIALEQDEPEECEDDDVQETPLEQAWGVLRSLRRLSAQPSLSEGRDLAEARKCAQALLGETWVAAFREASEAMNPGAQEPGEDLGWWVAYGLEARLLLEAIAGELLAPELFDDIERVDGVLAPFSPALAVIPGDDYDDIASLGGFPDGWASWREQHAPEAERFAHEVLLRWGKQETSALARNERLARMLSWSGAQARLGVLEAQHQASRPANTTHQFAAAAASSDTVAFVEGIKSAPRAEQTERLDQFFTYLKGISCPWMREDLEQATESLLKDGSTADLVPQIRARLRPKPGNVPLLLALTGTSLGDVWQLRVRRRSEPGDPWEKSGILQTVARDSIRTAFEAAAACMPQGLPPRPFEDHSVELVGGAFNGIDAIDGQSVGLAAALAFVSLWLDASIPEDLACSAAIRSSGELMTVGFVREKTEALARLTGRPLRLLLARGNHIDFPERISTIHARSLEEALEFAHLAPHHTQAKRDAYVPWLGSVTDRLDRLRHYRNHVEHQNLADYLGKGMDPWLVLGDRIRLLIDSLSSFEDAQTRQEVARARADAALAFTHGLDGFSANQMLRDLDHDLLHPSVRLYAGIIELDHLLDKCSEGSRSWEETLPFITSLERSLAALSGPEQHTYEGRVLGTIGRVWMHQRKLPEAIDYLRRAVDSHDAHLWQEAGRSRIYLATALRMNGSLDEAAKTLDAAMPLLDRCRYRWNASYAEHTVLFWTYELARLLLELGRPLDAIAALESKLNHARLLGSWPLAGMLRTLAWAAAAASLPDKQQSALDELHRIAGEDTFLRTLHQEASGPFRRDGEVY